MQGLARLIYLPWYSLRDGFWTSALVRFVAEDDAYLSHTHGGPALLINLEVRRAHRPCAPGPGRTAAHRKAKKKIDTTL